ncbi:hypothetical protein KY310_00205 [Candidatus Woesearchaeota archaeon]|nr:hypothetical protein [Candidatus Woesearchaeota archaeon]
MTEIPERQEGQTWANYFIERLKERGADASLRNPHLEISDPHESIDYVCDIGEKPEIKIKLGFSLDTALDLENDGQETDLATTPRIKYSNDLVLYIADHGEGEAYLHVFNNDDKLSDIDAMGNIADIIPIYKDVPIGETVPDIPAAEIFCALADYVKQRQDFYKQEEQK